MKTTRTALSTLTTVSVFAIAGLAGCAYGLPETQGDDTDMAGQESSSAEQALDNLGDDPADPPVIDPEPSSPDLTVTETAIGDGWRRIHFEGMIADGDTGAKRQVNQDVMVIDGSSSISKSPVPAKTKQALLQEAMYKIASEANDVIVVDEAAANDYEAQTVTPYAICNDEEKVYSKSFGVDRSYSYHKGTVTGSFTGSADFNASLSANATAKLTVRAHRRWVLGCRTVWVTYKRMDLQGDGTVNATVNANATFEKEWHWSKQVAKPTIATWNFMAGPIPVRLGLNAPITVGIDAMARAKLSARGSAVANGTFNVYCNTSACDGTRSGSAGYTPDGDPSIEVTGRVQVTPWAQGALRAYLYSESVAQAQVGVRADLAADLWAYAGDTCGDANNDGTNEWVSALTFDMQGKLSVTARAEVATHEVYSNKWNVYSTKHYFWDLIGSSALNPIFYVSSTSGDTRYVKGRMRPCYPYSDSMNYEIQWGDGSAPTTFSNAPGYLWTKSHEYKLSPALISVKAKTDSAGRAINHTTSRSFLKPVEMYQF